MTVYAPLVEQPAFWGVMGAFIYAAPQWVACLVHCRDTGERGWTCTLEFAIALVTGGIAAAAFSRSVVGFTPIKDLVPIAATIGLLANSTAPVLIRRLSALVGTRLGGKVAAALPGEAPDERP